MIKTEALDTRVKGPDRPSSVSVVRLEEGSSALQHAPPIGTSAPGGHEPPGVFVGELQPLTHVSRVRANPGGPLLELERSRRDKGMYPNAIRRKLTAHDIGFQFWHNMRVLGHQRV